MDSLPLRWPTSPPGCASSRARRAATPSALWSCWTNSTAQPEMRARGAAGSGSEQLTARNARPGFAHRRARDGCVVVGLAAQPPSVAEPKVAAQPQVSVCRDGPLAGHDIPDSLSGHTDVFGQPVLRQTETASTIAFALTSKCALPPNRAERHSSAFATRHRWP